MYIGRKSLGTSLTGKVLSKRIPVPFKSKLNYYSESPSKKQAPPFFVAVVGGTTNWISTTMRARTREVLIQ